MVFIKNFQISLIIFSKEYKIIVDKIFNFYYHIENKQFLEMEPIHKVFLEKQLNIIDRGY